MAARRSRRKKLPEEPVEAVIESISTEGRGIAHIDERTVFIEGALDGERVMFQYTRMKKDIAEGRVVEVIEPSVHRCEPVCSVFGICGGCNLQHMEHEEQVRHKQQTLLDQLRQIAAVQPDEVLAPITGPTTSYRYKARLGVRNVPKKGKVLVGFRERGSSFITETERCEVLHASIGHELQSIAACIDDMELKAQIPQIEVAVGEGQTVLVFRHLAPISDADRDKLESLCASLSVTGYLQAGKPDDLELIHPESAEPLYYLLPEFDLRIGFAPSDFTQVNPDINRRMLSRAIEHLDLQPEDRVLDLFCGLGNFSLPLARHCRQVTGVEGSLEMVRKARENAVMNGIDNADFIYGDLYSESTLQEPWIKRSYDKVLLDPPRSGAFEVLEHLGRIAPAVIVYVSCHPGTLARDADILVNRLGYELHAAGIMDMFPHTAHVESMAVFRRK